FDRPVWRAQGKEVLAAFIQHLRDAGMYDRVLAFQIGAGSSGEWIKDTSCMLLPSNDFGPAMRRHFRGWLSDRYRGDEAALQAAWAEPDVTFATAEVPTHAMQSTTTAHTFRDP